MKRLVILSLVFSCVMFSNRLQRVGRAQDVTITINVADTRPDDGGRATAPLDGQRAAVDVAILLDTSNSMDGLIAQAKSQLWKIVQQFADAEKAGQTPRLRVAVFEYGNTRLPASEGYIRQVVQLTDDLDKVSEVLFALNTKGGDEYCGQVISEAITRLDWSAEPGAYKAIFIAGNEPFSQGPVEYSKACAMAIQSRVIVNTIHCGPYDVGVQGKWKHGAELAEGQFLNINQDRVVVHIDCPQDAVILKLNEKLNKTYLWYGKKSVREGYLQNQVAQDANAISQSGGGGFAGGRAATKSSKLYSNFGRDLIDSLEKDAAILAKVKETELPEELQKMAADKRLAHIQRLAKTRVAINAEIAKLVREREVFATKKRKALAAESGEDATLGDAIGTTVREQLKRAGFRLKK
jgi:hypothetical protein